jgi:hypothetical protein
MAEIHCFWLTSFTGGRIRSLEVGWTNGWASPFRSFIRPDAIRALAYVQKVWPHGVHHLFGPAQRGSRKDAGKKRTGGE